MPRRIVPLLILNGQTWRPALLVMGHHTDQNDWFIIEVWISPCENFYYDRGVILPLRDELYWRYLPRQW